MDVGTLKSYGLVTSEGTLELRPAPQAGKPAVDMRFFEDFNNGSNFVGLKAPAALAGNTPYTLPNAYPAANGQALVSTTAGVMSWATAGGVFGDGYHYQEKTALQTTTSNAYQEYTKLTTAALAAGTYKIGWTVVWNYSTTGASIFYRVQVDDSVAVIDPGNGGEAVERPTNGATVTRHARSGSRNITLGAGVHTVDIDFKTTNDAVDTARMYFGNIELWRVA